MTATLTRKPKKAAPEPRRVSREEVAEICAGLKTLQRQRSVFMKSRIMVSNRLQAIVAGATGYKTTLTEKERRRRFREAAVTIAKVVKAEGPIPGVDEWLAKIILAHHDSVTILVEHEAGTLAKMKELARRLPVIDWVVKDRQQLGFDVGVLATLVGDVGDFWDYPNPAKVWKRMGCAPIRKGDRDYAGSTLRKMPKALTKEEWQKAGYSPRRRSWAYIIGYCLRNGNKTGLYRARYDEARAKMKRDHEGDENYPDKRLDLHGIVCAAKLLMKNLWIEWRKY